jgi:transcriptional regulator with XRE-family HTH domain
VVICSRIPTMRRMEPFASIIRQSLNSRGWSQSELCRRCGISKAAMSRYVNGERTPSFLDAAQISRVLGIPLDHLAGISAQIPTDEEREILRIVRDVGIPEARRGKV